MAKVFGVQLEVDAAFVTLFLAFAAGITLLLIIITVHLIFVKINSPKRSKKSLDGKHVLITGGSSGIGKSLAIECVKLGANVTIVARNNVIMEKAAEEITTFTRNKNQFVRTLQLDVADPESMKLVSALDANNPIYMLVNCAGLAICGTLENLSAENINTMIGVNLMGTINTTKALVAAMKVRGDGIIVNVSSQGGLIGIFGYTGYAASKFGVRGFTEALEMEVRPHGIFVTLALPPDTDTAGFANENLSKPEETSIISESAGLVQPEAVASRLVRDAIAGRFYSYVGFESYLVTNICAGFAPSNCLFNVYWQALILGPLRIISSFVTHNFQSIVYQCHLRKIKR